MDHITSGIRARSAKVDVIHRQRWNRACLKDTAEGRVQTSVSITARTTSTRVNDINITAAGKIGHREARIKDRLLGRSTLGMKVRISVGLVLGMSVW